jgi:hypothetical protein
MTYIKYAYSSFEYVDASAMDQILNFIRNWCECNAKTLYLGSIQFAFVVAVFTSKCRDSDMNLATTAFPQIYPSPTHHLNISLDAIKPVS